MRIGDRFSVFSALLLFIFLLASPLMQAQKAARAAAPAIQPQRTSSNGGFAHAASPHASYSLTKSSTTHKSHSSPKGMYSSIWEPKAFGSLLPPAPGPGFEFGYLNGVNQGFGPVRRRRNGTAGSTLGYGSGFYLLSGGGYYAIPSDESTAQAAEDQQAPDQALGGAQDQSQPRESLEAQQSPSEPDQAAAAPVQDEGEFTLVLRDGTRISALAFTHSNDTIIYISPDGGRRTLANSDFDADATVRVNQERGTPLQLPL
jgi:hypothetical protein